MYQAQDFHTEVSNTRNMSSVSITRWTPDTCSSGGQNPTDSCVLEYDVDTSTTPPTLSNFRTLQLCSAHSVLSPETEETKVNAIRNENSRGHGNAFGTILENAPTSLYDTLPNGTRTFKQGITVTWAWSGTVPNRVLNITITGVSLTENQLNSIRAKLDERFGINNVILTIIEV